MSAGAIARQQSVQLEAAGLYGPFVKPAYSMPCNPTVGGFFRTTPFHYHLAALDSLAQTPNVSGGALPGVPMKLIW